MQLSHLIRSLSVLFDISVVVVSLLARLLFSLSEKKLIKLSNFHLLIRSKASFNLILFFGSHSRHL